MATRTVNSNDWIKPFRGNDRLLSAPEGSSQTFKKGAPLIFSAVSAHENEVIAFVEDSTTGLVGFAAQDATGTQGSAISYYIADTDSEFYGVVESAKATAWIMLTGGPYSMVYDATNAIWRIDTSDTSHDVLLITSLIDPVGTVNGRVSFVTLPAARLPFQG